MLCRTEVTFLQSFHQEYFRNNKTNGSKNIRCFPQCTSCHYKQGFCGQAVFAQLEVEYAPGEMEPDDLTIVGEFQPCSNEFDGIKNSIAESFLLKNSIPPNNRFVIAKTKVAGSSGDRSSDTTYLKLVNQVASPTFRISCMRRSAKQQRNVQDCSTTHQPATVVDASGAAATEFVHLSSPLDQDDSFLRTFEVDDNASAEHGEDRSGLPVACPSTPKRTVRSTPMNTVTPVKNTRRDEDRKPTSIARTISDMFRSTHTLSALGRMRSPFSLECDAIHLDLGDGDGGLMMVEDDPTTDSSSSGSDHSATTTVESVEYDVTLEGPHSMSLGGREFSGSPLPLFCDGDGENPVESVCVKQERCLDGMPPSQQQSAVQYQTSPQRPLPLFQTVGKREFAHSSDGSGNSDSDSELITLPKKLCTHTFYATHDAFKQEPTTRDAKSTQGGGSLKSVAPADEMVVLPTRGKMPVMRPSAVVTVALRSPPTPPSPCSPPATMPRNSVFVARNGGVFTSPTAAGAPYPSSGNGSDSGSPQDTRGVGKSPSVVVHGFPAFPSLKPLSAMGAVSALVSAATGHQYGASWSPRARTERHNRPLRQLFPDMVFPGDDEEEEEEELV